MSLTASHSRVPSRGGKPSRQSDYIDSMDSLLRLLGRHRSLPILLALFALEPEASAQYAPVELSPSGAAAGHAFGWSVGIVDDTIAIGAPDELTPSGHGVGSVHVLERQGAGSNAWQEGTELLLPAGSKADSFGISVAIDGDRILAGAPGRVVGSINSGAAYVFERNSGGANNWGPVAELVAADGDYGDEFGRSVALEDDWAVIGAPVDFELGTYAGAAYVFERDPASSAWVQRVKLLAKNGNALDDFGFAVAVSGDTAVVGAPSQGPANFAYGAAFVFQRDWGGPGNWGQVKRLKASDKTFGAYFATSVAISGDTILVGAPGHSHFAVRDGGVYVFQRDQGGVDNWGAVVEIHPKDNALHHEFGEAVAIEGGRAAASSPHNLLGAAYVFERDLGGTNNWGERSQYVPSSGGGFFDRYGTSLAISEDDLLVGMPRHSLNGTGQWIADPGVAFVYSTATQQFQNYCNAGISFSGCQAALAASGFSSASASSGFSLLASTIQGDSSSLFFISTSGRSAGAWGNGTSFQCMNPPIMRAGKLDMSGSPHSCDGARALDLNAWWCPTGPGAPLNPGAGALVQAQLWYRDPLSTSNQTTSLSDALEFVVGP